MKYQQRSLKLKTPMPLPTGLIEQREIYEYEVGPYNFEVSPLPGLSNESLEEAHQQVLEIYPVIEKLGKAPIKKDFDFKTTLFNKSLDDQFGSFIFPSVRFGLEAFLIQLTEQFIPPGEVARHELIPDLKDVQLDSIISSHLPSSLKIKIGKYDQSFEAEMINSLCQKGKTPQIKLDGNRSFSQSEFCRFYSQLSEKALNSILYFEEPLNDLLNYQGPPFDLGLDENLFRYDLVLNHPQLNLKAFSL